MEYRRKLLPRRVEEVGKESKNQFPTDLSQRLRDHTEINFGGQKGEG